MRVGLMATCARGAIGAIGAAFGLFMAKPALALDCSTYPNPIYIESGDTQEPLLKNLGQKLRASTAMPMTVIYRTTGTCQLTDDMYNGTKITVNPSYIPSVTEDPNWDPSKPSPTCTIASGGTPIDVAIGATFIESCNPNPPPNGLKLFEGPVQAYGFVVPKASTQTALTAEEGYFVFGFGNTGQITPWNDETWMFVRTPTKSTQLTLMAALSVPPGKTKGQAKDKSSEVLSAVAASTEAEKTIGLLGVEIYDANRDKVNMLAFRGFKQKYAYYPDSTPNARDKKNVRDGHYLPWAPTVYIVPVDGQGVPTSARTKYFLDLVLGNDPTPTFETESLQTVIARGLIPECAMKVTRSFEGGNLSLYDSPTPCGCYYDSIQGTTSCTQCTNDSPCGAGKCRHGYCEAK